MTDHEFNQWAAERARVARRNARTRLELDPETADKVMKVVYGLLYLSVVGLVLSRVI